MKRVCCLLSICLALAIVITSASQCAWAQEVTASITGTVSDPSGAAVANANVTATSVERGITYTAVSSDSGLYRISQLPVGSYSLRVEKSGFSVASHPAFVLTLNQVARVDVAMKVGQTSETVEVSGAAPVMETEYDAGRHRHQCGDERQSSACVAQLRAVDPAGARARFRPIRAASITATTPAVTVGVR